MARKKYTLLLLVTLRCSGRRSFAAVQKNVEFTRSNRPLETAQWCILPTHFPRVKWKKTRGMVHGTTEKWRHIHQSCPIQYSKLPRNAQITISSLQSFRITSLDHNLPILAAVVLCSGHYCTLFWSLLYLVPATILPCSGHVCTHSLRVHVCLGVEGFTI